MKRLLLLVALFALPLISNAKQSYFVEVDIISSKEEVASPALIIDEGIESRVSEEGVYDLSLLATSHEERKVFLKTNLTVNKRDYAPSILVELGKSARVQE